ncbi:MAG TPA: transglycosylase SLT domain-containing protein [Geobacterales bacterium]|nr:transglycosylase SLT domain-containing protein [Geobacterales bacterium]
MTQGITTIILLLLLATLPVTADIYKYVDEDGVLHFTDTPTDRRFKIYMRDIKRDRQLRTHFNLSACSRDPKEFEAMIREASRQYGVDEALVKAVIHAESNYNPKAVSRAGAQGLMQLMPKTAKALNVCDSFDPKQNIKAGVRYLRFLLDTFNGDVTLALAAYNAGLSRVAQYGGVPPYEETRTYVARVLSYQQVYASN